MCTEISSYADRLFRTLAQHMLQQRSRCLLPRAHVYLYPFAYRGDKGRRSPVGFLIDDKNYSSELEGKPHSFHRVREALRASGVKIDEPVVIQILDLVQQVYIGVDVEYWEGALRRVAEDLGLRWWRPVTVTTLEELEKRFSGGAVLHTSEADF